MTNAIIEPKFDKLAPQTYAADLYAPQAVAETVHNWDVIGERELAQYNELGYLAVENAFTPAEVAAMKDGLADLVMGRVAGFDSVEFERGAQEILPTLSLDERQDAVRKLMWFTPHEARLRATAEHPRLIALLTRLLDAPPQMFQDMALFKPPHIGREKPWHQDHAYFNLPEGTHVVGVWIALDEATLENGCMHFLPGGHKDGPVTHFNRRDWQICDTDILGKPVTAAPLPPGGALIFNGLLPHGTPHNRSGARRRAVQFHYHAQDVAQTTVEERMRIFGSEGRNVSC